MSSPLGKHIARVDDRYVMDSNVFNSPVDFKRLLDNFVCDQEGYFTVPFSVIVKEFDDKGLNERNTFFFGRGTQHETRPATMFVGSGSSTMGSYSSRIQYSVTIPKPFLRSVDSVYFLDGQDIMSWQVVELRRMRGKFQTLRGKETKFSEYLEFVVRNRRVEKTS